MSRHRSAQPLPPDCTLIPLRQGALLVSPDHATWCGLGEEEAALLGRTLEGGGEEIVPETLNRKLEEHGFFAPPRQAEELRPSVQLQITNACNLACSYCCTNSGGAREGELPRDRWLALVPEIREALGPGVAVAILGGEPLLRPWALELGEALLDAGLEVTLFSNGLPLADEALARRTAAFMARGRVRLSLAGPTPGSCDALSGAARFQGALEAVRRLARFGRLPVLDLMLTPGNAAEVAASLPGLRKALPEGTEIAFGILFHGGREEGANLFPSRAALEEALDTIAFGAGERIPGPRPSPLAPRRDGCACTRGAHLHVRSDGRLFTCFRMEERVGDLKRESFASVLARCTARPASSLAFCAACPLRSLCGAGCRAENLVFTGDGDRPVCGPWRVQVLAELLAEDRPDAVEWGAHLLLAEARRRGIPAPERLVPERGSSHVLER